MKKKRKKLLQSFSARPISLRCQKKKLSSLEEICVWVFVCVCVITSDKFSGGMHLMYSDPGLFIDMPDVMITVKLKSKALAVRVMCTKKRAKGITMKKKDDKRTKKDRNATNCRDTTMITKLQ